jgi:hypothetical protein
MKKMLAVFAALIAAMSGAMAQTTPIIPDWVEDLGPGMTTTSGQYETQRGVGEVKFTPQTMNSELKFDVGGVSADVTQKAVSSIVGTQTGMDRQFLTQSASAYAATAPGIAIDAEQDQTVTTLVMGIDKSQAVGLSTMLTSGLANGPDANGDGIPDDHYIGGHNLEWAISPAATGTFSETGIVTASGVSLKEALTDAKVTVTTQDLTPDQTFMIDDVNCAGNGEFWKGYATGTAANPIVSGQQKVNGPLDTTLGQLTETLSSASSTATLTRKLTSTDGSVKETTSLDGRASLDAAFQNAILGGENSVALEFNTGAKPFTFWWV